MVGNFLDLNFEKLLNAENFVNKSPGQIQEGNLYVYTLYYTVAYIGGNSPPRIYTILYCGVHRG